MSNIGKMGHGDLVTAIEKNPELIKKNPNAVTRAIAKCSPDSVEKRQLVDAYDGLIGEHAFEKNVSALALRTHYLKYGGAAAAGISVGAGSVGLYEHQHNKHIKTAAAAPQMS